jgi:WD40 repeat protein
LKWDWRFELNYDCHVPFNFPFFIGRQMNCRIAIILVFVLLFPGIALGDGRPLAFVKEIGAKTPTTGWMSLVSFSQDGSRVAANGQGLVGDSRDMAIWSFPGGRLISRLPIEPWTISPDWKYFTANWGVGGLTPPRILISGLAYPATAFSPDGRYIAASARGQSIGGAIHIFELPRGKSMRTFGRHSPDSLAISPDGHTLAAGYWDIITLWDMRTGERLAALRGFGRYVMGIAFSQDGKMLAAGTDFGSVQIWDVAQQRRIQVLSLGGLSVSTPAFSPDGHLVAAGIYGTGTVFLMRTDTGELLDKQKVSDIGCGSVAFSPDGQFLITPSTGGLIKWPYDHGGTIRVFRVNVH